MKNILVVSLLLFCAVSSYALTGFDVSNRFEIDDQTLPVTLLSFTAALTNHGLARLTWVSESESNLHGYYVYRSDAEGISTAAMVSGMIQATNTSSQHVYQFTDSEIFQSGTYYYWLYSLEMDGIGTYHGPVSLLINLEGDQGTPDIPLYTGLKSIYPNPFNPSTTIAYQITSPATVNIRIFNARGQLVNTLERDHSAAGEYNWIFSGVDFGGKPLSSGIYQVLMKVGKDVSNQKMVLMK
jgi:hypothetical protein